MKRVSSNRHGYTIVIAVLVCVLVGGLIVWRWPRVADRPVIKNLNAAPVSARPLIRSIAEREDKLCYPALIGAAITPKITVTKHNFQNYDFVGVTSVQNDGKIIFLSIDCAAGSSDPLVLENGTWKELGSRQM